MLLFKYSTRLCVYAHTLARRERTVAFSVGCEQAVHRAAEIHVLAAEGAVEAFIDRSETWSLSGRGRKKNETKQALTWWRI